MGADAADAISDVLARTTTTLDNWRCLPSTRASPKTERDDSGRGLTQIMGRVMNLFGTDERLYAARGEADRRSP